MQEPSKRGPKDNLFERNMEKNSFDFEEKIEDVALELENLLIIQDNLVEQLRNAGFSEEEIERIRSGSYPDAG